MTFGIKRPVKISVCLSKPRVHCFAVEVAFIIQILLYALERQSSLGEAIPGVHPAGISYMSLVYRTTYK